MSVDTTAPPIQGLQEPEPSDEPETQMNPGESGVFPRRRPAARHIAIAVGCMVLGLLLIPSASANFKYLHQFLTGLPLDNFFATVRQWPSFTTITGMILVIWQLDRKRRATIVVLLVAMSMGGLVNESLKQVTGRARPYFGVDLKGPELDKMHHLLEKYPQLTVVAQKRDQWLLMRPGRIWFDNDFASFASGHSVNSFVIGAFLSALYPEVRLLWYFLAAGCALSRVASKMHYPSDILFGAGMGWLIAQWVFSWRWPMRVGKRLLEKH